MKTIVVVVCICILGLVTRAMFAEEQLPIATGEWPPYTSESLEGYGFCTELVSAIVQEMGMTPEYKFYPWKRAEKMTRDGMVFGAFPYAITEKRQHDFDFSDMILQNKTVFFYQKQYFPQPPTWNVIEDLRAYRIGGTLGSSYISTFEKAGLNLQLVASEEQNLKKLETNRIDFMITDKAVGWHLIQQLFSTERDRFGTLVKPFVTGNSHLMISLAYPNHEQLRDRFNQALQQIKDKGIFQTILAKHGFHEP